MQGHDIVVIGVSAGGIEPLLQIVADLPSDLPAALFVVHHFPADSISALPNILVRAAELPVRTARHREAVTPSTTYVGRPDSHLLFMPGVVRLTCGPREHGNRPALDIPAEEDEPTPSARPRRRGSPGRTTGDAHSHGGQRVEAG